MLHRLLLLDLERIRIHPLRAFVVARLFRKWAWKQVPDTFRRHVVEDNGRMYVEAIQSIRLLSILERLITYRSLCRLMKCSSSDIHKRYLL